MTAKQFPRTTRRAMPEVVETDGHSLLCPPSTEYDGFWHATCTCGEWEKIVNSKRSVILGFNHHAK